MPAKKKTQPAPIKSGFNKKDLTEKLSKKAGIPKTKAASYLNTMIDIISEALISGKKVTISDFGTFNLSHRASFNGYNPQNSKSIAVPERVIPVFRAGKKLKNSLNIPFLKDCALVGSKSLSLTFSKPIKDGCSHATQKSKYTILVDGKKSTISNIKVNTSSDQGITSIKITTKSKLLESDIKIKFTGTLEDYNGNSSEGNLHWPQ